jgi:hypothetical protein
MDLVDVNTLPACARQHALDALLLVEAGDDDGDGFARQRARRF